LASVRHMAIKVTKLPLHHSIDRKGTVHFTKTELTRGLLQNVSLYKIIC